jgi:hypothetical protein
VRLYDKVAVRDPPLEETAPRFGQSLLCIGERLEPETFGLESKPV